MIAARPGLALATLVALSFLAHGEGEFVAPPASLVLDGIPPIPAEIAAKTQAYTQFKRSSLLDWHPQRREVIVRQRRGDAEQVQRVAEPGLAPEPLTDFADGAFDALYEPRKGAYALVSAAPGGSEEYRIQRLEPGTGELVPLSPAGLRAGDLTWNRKGDRVLFTTMPLDRHAATREASTTIHLADPLRPAESRALVTLPGGGWGQFDFSPDDKRVACVEYLSANESHLWMVELATGKARRITRGAKGGPVSYLDPHFSPDGRGLYATSDRDSEFRRLVYLDLATGRETALAARLAFDVEAVAVSFPARRVAFVTNEAGAHALRFVDTATRRELPRPALVPGVIQGLRWRRDGVEIAFAHASAKSPGDVFSYDVKAHRVTRWTNGNSPALNANEFVEPRTIRWKSFDGREITGLYYHPPSRFGGVRPVVVNIHGGPEGQAMAGFVGRFNYLVNELGIALIYPNVRGSSGFGKAFLALDDGRKREDSVKDIGALLDWIGLQPGLDAGRVLVTGGSYGGYMSLASSVHFAERIAGAVSIVGISNFVTFLERTETYRRDLRRAEYGDERDPAMREFLLSISPLSHASRITKPLLVAQGRNDPRVPWTEAEQIVAALKRSGTPVWYLLALDEGHGLRKKANADFAFFTTVEFIRRTLLAPAP